MVIDVIKTGVILLVILLLTSCGDSKVKVDDSVHKGHVEGETFNYVVVRFEFIKEIRELCEFKFPNDNNLMADCTFEHLSVLNVPALESFNNEYCNEELEDVRALEVCKALEGL